MLNMMLEAFRMLLFILPQTDTRKIPAIHTLFLRCIIKSCPTAALETMISCRNLSDFYS